MSIFQDIRQQFCLPEGVVYLNGNSLGPATYASIKRAEQVMIDEWSTLLVQAWNKADWMSLPVRTGNKIAGLIGAPENTVVMGDTLSIKVYQALSAALALRSDRKIILTDSGNFPTDIYMAQGLIATLNNGCSLQVLDPEEIEDNITEEVAVLMLTEVDYRTGRLHDMARLTEKAHDCGALVFSDLAHSAGALPVDLKKNAIDFAAGCSYKFLNGGPGSPAFIYVAEKHTQQVQPSLCGWMGHQQPFSFEPDYRPAANIERMRVGTPAIIQMSVLDTALDVWQGIDLQDLRKESMRLCETFITVLENHCPDLLLAGPRDVSHRGSHVSYIFQPGYPVIQALIAEGVIADFRAPNIMRFGFSPLYISEEDVVFAATKLVEVLTQQRWKQAKFQIKNKVT